MARSTFSVVVDFQSDVVNCVIHKYMRKKLRNIDSEWGVCARVCVCVGCEMGPGAWGDSNGVAAGVKASRGDRVPILHRNYSY